MTTVNQLLDICLESPRKTAQLRRLIAQLHDMKLIYGGNFPIENADDIERLIHTENTKSLFPVKNTEFRRK